MYGVFGNQKLRDVFGQKTTILDIGLMRKSQIKKLIAEAQWADELKERYTKICMYNTHVIYPTVVTFILT